MCRLRVRSRESAWVGGEVGNVGAGGAHGVFVKEALKPRHCCRGECGNKVLEVGACRVCLGTLSLPGDPSAESSLGQVVEKAGKVAPYGLPC